MMGKTAKTEIVQILLVVIVLVIAAFISVGYFRNMFTEPSALWFDDVTQSLHLSGVDVDVVLHSMFESLHSGNTTVDVPNDLQNDTEPRILFISVSTGRSIATVFIGRGYGFTAALKEIMRQIPDGQFTGQFPLWIKLDVVQDVQDREYLFFTEPFFLVLGLEGLSFENDVAFLPEEVTAYNLFQRGMYLDVDALQEYCTLLGRSSESFDKDIRRSFIEVRRFTTESFFYDGETSVSLYRGHRLFINASCDDLLNSVKNAGDYLTNAMKSDGSFVYKYLPTYGGESDEYNIVRHVGTVYSMLKLYEATHNEQVLRSAEAATSYFLQYVQPFGKGSCIVFDDAVELGSVALGVLTLVEQERITGDTQNISVMQQFGKCIQQMQKENGEFICKRIYSTGNITDYVDAYYPGESVLALCRLYAVDGNETWLDIAEKAARYLITVRYPNMTESGVIHDHWLLMALNELYRFRDNSLYVNYAMQMAESIMRTQRDGIQNYPEYPDWLGSYYTPPLSTLTATRTEGLLAAYDLVQEYGNNSTRKQIFNAIDLGIHFQLQTQLLPENVLYINDAQRVLGPFRNDLTTYDIRIDYTQHNLCSILAYYQIVCEKKEAIQQE